MNRPSLPEVAVATVAGLATVAVVLALYARAAYPALESSGSVAVLAVTGFAVGFLPVLAAGYTRLLSPATTVLAALAGTVYVELTTPAPEWSTLGEFVVVDGPTHVGSYANTWYLWLALALYAGVLEFGVRRGYAVGDDRLRNLPALPLSRRSLVGTVGGGAGALGLATTLLVLRAGIRPSWLALVVLAFTVAVAAVPIAGVLTRGLVSPVVLFAVVPYFLTIEAFVATDSPVHILLFGPLAVVLAVTAAIEATIRSRLGDRGGGFAEPGSA